MTEMNKRWCVIDEEVARSLDSIVANIAGFALNLTGSCGGRAANSVEAGTDGSARLLQQRTKERMGKRRNKGSKE